MINKSSLLVSASLLGLLASGSLLAATATDTFEVSINVENSCTIAVNDLPFLYATADQAYKVLDGKAGEIMAKDL